ncbi:hypothetical protein M2125_001012 [Polynucleobacter sphagniphilus]|uniref:hypothetical protein n=1 Tax=Polynucleobacter sphagniphilus TaxID=1743169 RepID=UPI00247427E4|nr:hypothetical protein [Polynucleobacter sphagniphilus]MDH6241205.1 hypothetical protein [Polynucleobacter sphagniphilus]
MRNKLLISIIFVCSLISTAQAQYFGGRANGKGDDKAMMRKGLDPDPANPEFNLGENNYCRLNAVDDSNLATKIRGVLLSERTFDYDWSCNKAMQQPGVVSTGQRTQSRIEELKGQMKYGAPDGTRDELYAAYFSDALEGRRGHNGHDDYYHGCGGDCVTPPGGAINAKKSIIAQLNQPLILKNSRDLVVGTCQDNETYSSIHKTKLTCWSRVGTVIDGKATPNKDEKYLAQQDAEDAKKFADKSAYDAETKRLEAEIAASDANDKAQIEQLTKQIESTSYPAISKAQSDEIIKKLKQLDLERKK